MADKNQTNDSPPSRKPGVVINRRVTPAADAKPASPLPQPGDPPALVRHKKRVAAAEAVKAAAEAGAPPPEGQPEPERIAKADLAPFQQSVMNAELMKRSAETAQARAGEAAQASNAARLALFVKYGLRQTDTFDIKTGLVTRGTATPTAPPAAEKQIAKLTDQIANSRS